MCASPFQLDTTDANAEEETLIFVGKHRPLSDYPLWARWVVRFAYWLTDYSDAQESAGIAHSWEEAAALCVDRPAGYFGQRLPIGSLLPDEPCQLEPTVFFKTDAPEFYRKYKPKFLAVPVSTFNRLDERIEHLTNRTNPA
jgi:hypothetical protein